MDDWRPDPVMAIRTLLRSRDAGAVLDWLERHGVEYRSTGKERDGRPVVHFRAPAGWKEAVLPLFREVPAVRAELRRRLNLPPERS